MTETVMRKVRDYDAELKALGDKARALKAKKVQQFGELVAATGADTLNADMLAGALLFIVQESTSAGNREAWRSDGAAFFQRRGRKATLSPRYDGQDGGVADPGEAQG